MDTWKTIKDLSFKFFGRSLEPFVGYFESIKYDLLRSNLGFSLTEYVYSMFFILLLLFVVEFPTIVVITAIVLKDAAMAFLLSFTLTTVVLLLVFSLFYMYPSMASGKRKKSIDATLPFGTTYLATIASSGAPPIAMFKIMSQFPEYGELSVETGKIYRDVEAFGMDLLGAIRKTAARTPSEELKELLWGLDTVLSSGGNVGDFLHEKSRGFIAEYKRRLEQYSRTLSLLIEVYLTIVLVGSIFFIIMTALMSILGGGGDSMGMLFLQFMVIFIALPCASLGFIGLLKAISPSG
ncbi:MAG: type II secretion system F family protein [Candidatus Aenigmatarchaeota archaeon]